MPTRKQKKDQYVALCADSRGDAERLLPVVRPLAEKLHKGIIVFTCSPDGDSWVEAFGVPYVTLKSNWSSVVEAMPTAFNVLLAVALVDPVAPRNSLSHPRQFLKHFRQSKIAYLAIPVHPRFPASGLPFSTVALTLNHQRESKEKLLWASYFARFCQSVVAIYHYPYSDPSFRRRFGDNVRYLEKLFSSFGLGYDLRPLTEGSQFVDTDPRAIVQQGIDLFIAQVADDRERDFLDLLSPPPALKLMKKAPSLPILFLNQRDDLYIMCD